MCKGGAQNATVCKFRFCNTKGWKGVLVCRVAFKNIVYKPSYSARSCLTMASTPAEIAGLQSCEGRIEKPPNGMSAYIM